MIDHASEKMPDFENQNNTASEVVEARFAVVSKDFIENLLDISAKKASKYGMKKVSEE